MESLTVIYQSERCLTVIYQSERCLTVINAALHLPDGH